MCEILDLYLHFSAKPKDWSVRTAPCEHYADTAAWPQIDLCRSNLQLRGQWVDVTEQGIFYDGAEGWFAHREAALYSFFVTIFKKGNKFRSWKKHAHKHGKLVHPARNLCKVWFWSHSDDVGLTMYHPWITSWWNSINKRKDFKSTILSLI